MPNTLRIIILIIISVVYTGVLTAQKTLMYSDKTFLYELSLDSTISVYNNYWCHVKSIFVIEKSGNKLVQTIAPPEDNSSICGGSQKFFIIEDVNFDGLNDIRLLAGLPAYANFTYYYWTFDSNANQFQKDTILEEIPNPIFDHDNKLIHSSWIGDDSYGESTYKYVDGKLVLTEETLKDNRKYPRDTTVKYQIKEK